MPAGFGVSPRGDAIACVRYISVSDGNTAPFLSRSSDGGENWSQFERVDPGPFAGMGIMGNLTSTRAGTMVMAAEWSPVEYQSKRPQWTSLITRSEDGGRTWSGFQRGQVSPSDRLCMDPRLTVLPDDRLLAAYWSHDMENDQGLNVHTAWSSDQGATWTEPQDADSGAK